MDSDTARRARRRLLGWGLLAATTLLLASFSEAVFAQASAQAAAALAYNTSTPATAALADGDDIQAQFLIELRAESHSRP
jgi:hypothetical protein